jgi:hypothetical protein
MAWTRGLAESAMTGTAQVIRTVETPDTTGGQTAVETVVATYPCRLTTLSATTLSATERPEGGRAAAVTIWRCFLPAGAVLSPTDIVQIDGVRYEVTDDDRARTDGVMVTVNLRRAR